MSPKSLEVQIKHLQINSPITVRQLAQSGLSKYVHVVVVEEVKSRNKAQTSNTARFPTAISGKTERHS